MTTVIIFYNAFTKQYYIRLLPGVLTDLAKDELLKSLHAVNAGAYKYGQEPDVNRLYFQEFDTLDTAGVYYNINGDRPIYDLIECYDRGLEYYI